MTRVLAALLWPLLLGSASGAPGCVSEQGATEPQAGDTIHVRPGDDVVALVNAAAPGAVILLSGYPDGSPYTYEIGTAVLRPPDGATIRGPAASRTREGGVVVPVGIHGSGPQVFDLTDRAGLVIEHLDVSGARYDGAVQQTGVCILRGQGTYRFLRVHDCDNVGLTGWAGALEDSELYDNSARRIGGISAASKSVRPHAIRRSYIHDNHFHGVWLDCDGANWEVSDNTIVRNFGTGVFYEISRGPALIARNRVEGNNQGAARGRGGVIVTSSMNVDLVDNTIRMNAVNELRVWEDHRAGNGAAGCRSGYRVANVRLEGNRFGPTGVAGTSLPGVTVH